MINPDTGVPVLADEDQLRRSDFRTARMGEMVGGKTADKARVAGFERQALTGGDGAFAFANVPFQTCSLRVEAPGFAPDGKTARYNFQSIFVGTRLVAPRTFNARVRWFW